MGARCTAHTEQSVLGEVGTYYSSLSIKSANKAITLAEICVYTHLVYVSLLLQWFPKGPTPQL